MILSNRKLKLIIISLLLLIFAYFLGIFKVNAQVTSAYGFNETSSTYGVLLVQMSNKSQRVNFERTIFRNTGNGNILFNLNMAGLGSATTTPLAAVRAIGEVAEFECQMGSGFWYYDNGTQRIILPVTCPYNSDYGNGFKGLELIRESNTGSLGVYVPTYYTFVYGDNVGQQTQDITSAINSATTAIINAGGTNTTAINSAINAQTQSIVNAIQNNSTAITNIQNNTSDIKDAINDSSIDSNQASSSASSWNGKNATNGTITQLLTLPITLLQAIVNGLQTSCSSFSLGSLFGTNISLPCIDLSSLIGNGLFTTIDILFSGFMILSIAKKLIKIFNDFTNLKSNQIDELYGGGSK